jgi:type I restriction-modification system DNA methylase subunit
MENIEALEKRLWSSADNLRANSPYASNEYFLPVMGLIFLRHAYSRYLAVKDGIEASLPKRSGKTRPLTREDFSRKGAIFLRPKAQFEYLVNLPDNKDRAQAIINAMESIEEDYETLRGIPPKSEYLELDNDVLGQLFRTFDDPALKKASGDIFGRIYEYFLTQFADQKAHDNGEFFTPVSLVQMIVNVIEPDHGKVLDPACGSGGMFVQSAHFIERMHEIPQERVTFYGQEKNPTTIRLAKMNLAVHGLEGNIQKGITYYEDHHEMLGKADFVMANPPFNVDEVDASKVKNDPRLPFGLPGVNKKKAVSNGNYLWISYFYSYLNEQGRSGFVMSSQASSAGRDEAKVRRKIVEKGHVDVMIAIRSNFFYTRSVPCELWFIDRSKFDDLSDQPSPPTPLPEVEGSKGNYRGGYNFSGLVKRARELRKKQTPAEDLFWELVRNRKFIGLKFRRQHQIGDYVTDFYCHDCKTVIELDGPVHDKKARKVVDKKRDNYLKSQGIHVVRIKNASILDNPKETLQNIATHLSPQIHPTSTSGRGAGGEGQSSRLLNTKSRVLMIDARNVYRQVTRKIYDFSPEQMKNLTSIVWLYRGQNERFLSLVAEYMDTAVREAGETFKPLEGFKKGIDILMNVMEPFLSSLSEDDAHGETLADLNESQEVFGKDIEVFHDTVKLANAAWKSAGRDNEGLHRFSEVMAQVAEKSRELGRHTDQIYRLALRLIELCEKKLNARENDFWAKKEINQSKKTLDEKRKTCVEQLRQARYFYRQARWLQERFPESELLDVEGLVKLVGIEEIEKNDWSLTPGRYVGVAPEEVDEDFDFDETMRAIHAEINELNAEAVELAEQIAGNFEELGI